MQQENTTKPQVIIGWRCLILICAGSGAAGSGQRAAGSGQGRGAPVPGYLLIDISNHLSAPYSTADCPWFSNPAAL